MPTSLSLGLSTPRWTDDTNDLPLQYSFAYLLALAADGGGKSSLPATTVDEGASAGIAAVGRAEQIRGKTESQFTSFSPSAGNGSAILTVHDVWGGTATVTEVLNVVSVTLDTKLVGSAAGWKWRPRGATARHTGLLGR